MNTQAIISMYQIIQAWIVPESSIAWISESIPTTLGFTTNEIKPGIGLFFTDMTPLSQGTDGFDREDAMSDNRESFEFFFSPLSLVLRSHSLFRRAQTLELLEQNLTNEKSRLIKEQIESERKEQTECFGGVPGKAAQSSLSLRRQGQLGAESFIL